MNDFGNCTGHADLVAAQQRVCGMYGFEFVPASLDSKIGFAICTQGRHPVNGLRHTPEGGTNGWYIWCGEEFSSDSGFFSPLHTMHLADRCAEALQFLGLPPGCRFLLAKDYVDVWFDDTLLL